MDMHFTNDNLQDLSKDALQQTSEKARKRAGIFTAEEVALAKKCSKAIRAEELRLEKEVAKSGISKKKYFKHVEAEQMLTDEKANVKSLAKMMASNSGHGTTDMERVIEFNDTEDFSMKLPCGMDIPELPDGLFGSDSDEAEVALPAVLNLQSKMAMFEDDSD